MPRERDGHERQVPRIPPKNLRCALEVSGCRPSDAPCSMQTLPATRNTSDAMVQEAAVASANPNTSFPQTAHEFLPCRRAGDLGPGVANPAMRMRVTAGYPSLAGRFRQTLRGAILDGESRAVDGFERVDPGQ